MIGRFPSYACEVRQIQRPVLLCKIGRHFNANTLEFNCCPVALYRRDSCCRPVNLRDCNYAEQDREDRSKAEILTCHFRFKHLLNRYPGLLSLFNSGSVLSRTRYGQSHRLASSVSFAPRHCHPASSRNCTRWLSRYPLPAKPILMPFRWPSSHTSYVPRSLMGLLHRAACLLFEKTHSDHLRSDNENRGVFHGVYRK